MAHRPVGSVARAAAPVRLDFAGAWTDVPPFSTDEGGAVITASINLYARAEAVYRERGYLLRASELGAELEIPTPATPVNDPRLILHAAALRLRPASAPCELTTSSDVPPGSGLGSSGALDVAIVAALAALDGTAPAPLDLAHEAWRLEAVEAGVPGGKQDQYSAALGGFNLLTFRDPDVGVTSLDLDPGFSAELARRMVLCYTGASRVSGNTIARVQSSYIGGNAEVTGALHELREVALDMAEAMRAGDFAAVGALLTRNWQAQQRLDPIMCTEGMKELESAMQAAGAIGGKAAGSGAGGCMFFLAGDDGAAMRDAAKARGLRVLPVEWATRGVHQC
jgi:D-glycero-alpha-D-manno-heptose-7-phosphate kinase